MQKRFLVFSGFSGAIGVALGAMAAHFLKSKLEAGLITESNLQAFDTAAKYQLFHSLALFGVALYLEKTQERLLVLAGNLFMAGIVFFSGSLYILSTAGLMGLSDVKWLGPITPIGGLFMIAGWLCIAFAALKKK